MIKTDPSQTKAVVVLLVILAGAVVATVARVHPGSAQQSTSNTQGSAAAATSKECTVAGATIALSPASRNPFRKPDAVRNAVSRGIEEIGIGAAAIEEQKAGRNGQKFDLARIGPMPPGAVGEARPEKNEAKAEESRPQFALLTTVSGSRGVTAVIRIDESNTRVVGVGDTVDGHFRVVKLEQNRAVLRNGSDEIEIKRPG